MEGAALAAKRKQESDRVNAWHTGLFSGLASAGKLKKYESYTPKTSARPQTPEEMLAILQELKERGAPMNIKRVN